MPFHRKNHYVSRGYLKRWASDANRVWVYRSLVSHPNVPLWEKKSIRGIAYHSHLYSRALDREETDEFERWLDRTFEAPAEEALSKATSGARMTPDDWKRLIHFAVAQDVRTPARLLDGLDSWPNDVKTLLDETLPEAIQELTTLRREGKRPPRPTTRPVDDNPFPVRITTGIEPGAEEGWLKADITVGRQLWLHNMRHILTTTIKKLPVRNWTILSPPKGLRWITSDKPVLRLNYYRAGNYDFKGGWGNKGSEIIFPLSPYHLLYTQVGTPAPARGEEVSADLAIKLRRLIAEHSHRLIFSETPEAGIEELRPRLVNEKWFNSEKQEWESWHEEQSRAERELLADSSPE